METHIFPEVSPGCMVLGLGRASWWEEPVLEESGRLHRGEEDNQEGYLQHSEACHQWTNPSNQAPHPSVSKTCQNRATKGEVSI